MDDVSLRVPRGGTHFWLDVKDIPVTAVHLSQYVGERYKSGTVCTLEVGAVVLKVQGPSFNNKPRYTVSILLPHGKWYDARDCAPPGCAQLLREYIRTWLTLSPECRIVRGAEEMTAKIQAEIDEYLDEDPSRSVDDGFAYTRLIRMDELASMSATFSSPPRIIDEITVFDAFQRWLEAMSSMSEIPPEQLYEMLIRGAQRAKTPHVNYLKRFNRAVKFQKDNKSDE
jgi:hypothetical protein|tara:strand:+ start:1394 stop:2074 length:681 start_codon:yes stop_codon:yes gene_type:complete